MPCSVYNGPKKPNRYRNYVRLEYGKSEKEIISFIADVIGKSKAGIDTVMSITEFNSLMKFDTYTWIKAAVAFGYMNLWYNEAYEFTTKARKEFHYGN